MKSKKFICTIVFSMIITVIFNWSIFLLIYGNNEKNPIFSQNKNIKINTDIKYPEINIDNLLKDYCENEEYGNNEYRDKIYTVIGRIENIESEEDYVTINLYSDTYKYINVSCTLNIKENDRKERDKIIKYRQNDKIKITGLVIGKFYDIILDNCIIGE